MLDQLNINELARTWLELKSLETRVKNERAEIEAQLLEHGKINEADEGTKTIDCEGYSIKATCKMTTKVDANVLIEVAHENGLSDHLETLFRWKPELNLRAWKSSSEAITKPLSVAITTKPSKPGFKITKK